MKPLIRKSFGAPFAVAVMTLFLTVAVRPDAAGAVTASSLCSARYPDLTWVSWVYAPIVNGSGTTIGKTVVLRNASSKQVCAVTIKTNNNNPQDVYVALNNAIDFTYDRNYNATSYVGPIKMSNNATSGYNHTVTGMINGNYAMCIWRVYGTASNPILSAGSGCYPGS